MRERLEQVRNRIRDAADRCDRDPEAIRLLAVSKAKPASDVAELAGLGQRAFGENYLQEALDKIQAVPGRDRLEWHFIGPLQSNKTRAVAEHFDWVQTVDRQKIARRLNDQRPDTLEPLQVCIQVNISDEPQKAGVMPGEALDLAEAIAGFPKLRLRGLMCLPAPAPDEDAARVPFRRMRALATELGEAGHDLDTLSMGMSGDLEAAVLEGSTLVRVGSALFGPRE
jgi:pyridoxal phosphate enzyme (YggS family)